MKKMVCDQNFCQNIWQLLTYSLSLHTKLIIMAKREYVRHIVAYKDYFKDFKKELPRKSQKTPKAEIEKAKRIMNEYYEQKKQMI